MAVLIIYYPINISLFFTTASKWFQRIVLILYILFSVRLRTNLEKFKSGSKQRICYITVWWWSASWQFSYNCCTTFMSRQAPVTKCLRKFVWDSTVSACFCSIRNLRRKLLIWFDVASLRRHRSIPYNRHMLVTPND